MKKIRVAAALAGAVALAAPASVSAHPSVYTDQAIGDADPGPGFTPQPQTRHVITNHGFTYVLRETNGREDHGMITYSRLPGDYRRPLPKSQYLVEGDTGAQPHATCWDVAALWTDQAILGWQAGDAGDGDPFYRYVPFQATEAKLDDNPATWLPTLRAAGVDVSRLGDPAAAAAECARLGGTYVAPDAIQSSRQSLASGTVREEVAAAVAPLNAQIAQLGRDKAAAESQAADALARLRLLETPVGVSLTGAGSRTRGAQARITGRAMQAVSVRLLTSKSRAKRLRLASRVLATRTVVIGANGSTTVTLKPSKSVAARLASRVLATRTVVIGANGSTTVTLKPSKSVAARLARGRGSLGITVDAVTLGRSASARGTLAR